MTPRQRQYIKLIARGYSVKEIAFKLGISVKTVEAHRAALHRATGATCAVDVVRVGLKEKIITLEDFLGVSPSEVNPK